MSNEAGAGGRKTLAAYGTLAISAVLACLFWRFLDDWIGVRQGATLRIGLGTGAFFFKALVAAALLGIPAGFLDRGGARKFLPAAGALAGALSVWAGQWLLYGQRALDDDGKPLGLAEGIGELLWDLSFKGRPATSYGGAALVGAGAFLILFFLTRKGPKAP